MFKTIRFLKSYGIKKTVLKIVAELYWRVVKLLHPKYVSSVYGPKFHSNFSDATFSFYIRASPAFYFADFLKNMNQPFVFLDVGANQGLFSLIAAKNPNCKKVWAFEPVKKTYDLLCDNISVNESTEKVDPVRAAISNGSGEKMISINLRHSGEASLEHSPSGAERERVSCISFESLQKIVTFDDSTEAIVKIDTEGHEPIVVSELRKSNFWRKVRFVFFEVDERWFSGESLIGELEQEGFKEIFRTPFIRQHYDVLMQRVSPSFGVSVCV